MARLLVGMPSFKGKLAAYATRFDVVEVRPVDSPIPKAGKLARWREDVPASFAFSIILPAAVGRLEHAPEALREALEAARVLQASTLVLATPATVRPTRDNRARIRSLAADLPQDAHTLAWAPAGIWETEDIMTTASEGGWLPVFDAAQEPVAPGPIVYTRIRSLGHATHLGADRIDHIAHQLAGRRQATVIVEGEQASKLRNDLRGAIDRLAVTRPTPALFRPQPLATDDEEQ